MSKEERKDRYIQFPLCLLKETYKNPSNGLDLIICFGVVHFAKTFKYDITEVARQLMYAYYRNQSMIQKELFKAMERYINNDELSIDPDYEGFSGLKHGTTFDPGQSIEDLLKLFESDMGFKKDAILRYQISQAISNKFLSLTMPNIDFNIERYNEAIKIKQNFEQSFGADAMPMIKPSLLIEFRDSGKDIDLLRAYIAISSVIGQRKFISCNKPAILSRMIGCKSKAAFDYYTTDKFNKDKKCLLPTVEKYNKRYQMDKLLFTLAERQFIMFLSKPKVSVIYLSKYMEPEELSRLIKETKDRQNLKQRIKDATASL